MLHASSGERLLRRRALADAVRSRCAAVTTIAALARCLREICPVDACTFLVVSRADRLALLDKSAIPALLRLSELAHRAVCPIFLTVAPDTVMSAVEASDRRPIPIKMPLPAGGALGFPPVPAAAAAAASVSSSPQLRAALLRHVSALMASVCGPSSPEIRYSVATLWPVFEHHVTRLAGPDALEVDEVPPSTLAAALRALQGDAMLLRRRLYHHDVQIRGQASASSPAASVSLVEPVDGLELPYVTKFVLVGAFLASVNPPDTDRRYFTKQSKSRSGGRGSGGRRSQASAGKRAKAAKALLMGPRVFPLDRLLAIVHAVMALTEGDGAAAAVTSVGVQGELASLLALGLVEQVGTGQAAEQGPSKFRCITGKATIEEVADKAGIELASFLFEPESHG
jgi:origin recognition complex subunit 5